MRDFDIGSGVDREVLRRLGEEARSRTCDPGERPDCFRASNTLSTILANRGVASTIEEYRPRQGYTHYAVYIPAGELGSNAVVIDPTFDQFGTGADTSVNLSAEVPRIKIADPASTYIFADEIIR
jgi:hypothetical protein